ncbi:MAG TPA: lysylphosphatidylglycerol synthase transmembrane domain-containing protein [Streptosporangiaceae bacterium]|nr:lysylphosphatidylglycerol synthase transmembrane domain-containing protein [Streptosporangiaceae bacterium]
MTMSPGTQVRPLAEAAKHGVRLLRPARYRHPGDVIRLIIAGLVLAGALAVTVATHATYAGASAAAVTAVAPATLAGRVLAGLVQVVLVTAAAAALVLTLRYRRFRLLASLAGGAVLASAVVIGIIDLAGGQRPRDLATGASQWPWLTGASLAGPALLAAAVAVTVAAAPWLSRPWRRTACTTLWLAAVVRLITGTASPAEAVVAFAAGVTAGAAVLVLFGVPDRRLGPQEIAAALGSAGLPVTSVEPAGVEAKGSRPFVAAAGDGKPLFIKVLGSDQRDADLLYRAYRFIRLREVGDTRPAASLIQAVEHQALAAVMAERAGVAVPAVRQVIKTADGSALLAMDRVDGSALDQIPAQRLSDTMLRKLWEQVDRLHRARIAHRSLRAANIVADGTGRPWVVDFSFSELGASPRQMALDVAELLASLAAIIGADKAVAAAAAVIGSDSLAAAVPLLQPLALSAGTRRAIARHDGLLTQTRAAAAAASGREDTELARIQRVRPRTLLAIAALAGAFYYLLPQLAQVGSSWRAVQSADWAWLPLVIALSAVTYLASAVGLIGAVLPRIRFWPTVLAQAASSFVNRVSPANVGGMALNARYLQKSGVETSAGVAAVGVNSLAGAIVHLVLLVVFFTWSGHGLAHAFKLPSSSKLLLILAIIAAIVGIVLVTRPGRRFAAGTLIPGLKSAAVSLRRVARNPVKMLMLFGGSALVTLAYVGALAASVQAFGGGPGVYMGAAAIAAAAPSPGGLGAIEAALVAGLTSIGMQAGPAVSAVLLYRLVTYWLPVVPGWLSWRALQRRDYV